MLSQCKSGNVLYNLFGAKIISRAQQSVSTFTGCSWVVLTFSFLFLQSCHSKQHDSNGTGISAIAKFEMELDDLRKTHKIAGLSYAIFRSDTLLSGRGFGYSHLEDSVRADLETPYRIASITKPFSSTLILQL